MNADMLVGWTLVAGSIIALAWGIYTAAGWHVSRMVAAALNTIPDLPLPAPDADDAAFEAWCWQALGIANTPIHDQLAADQLRAELDDPAAIERWLSA